MGRGCTEGVYLPWPGRGAGIYLRQGGGVTYLGQGVPTLAGEVPSLDGNLDGGVPTLVQDRYPPGKVGTPLPGRQSSSEYLLHGRRYASCIRAGGLSCLNYNHKCNVHSLLQ